MIRIATAILIFICCLPVVVRAQNVLPTLSNVQFKKGGDAGSADIYYDLADPDDRQVGISFQVYDDRLRQYVSPEGSLTGDVGKAVSPGQYKHIQWAGASGRTVRKIRLVADDFYRVSCADLVNAVDTVRLKQRIGQYAVERNYTSPAATAQFGQVQTLITDAWTRLPLAYAVHDTVLLQHEVRQHVFQDLPVKNLVATLPGVHPEAVTYVLGGHYDSDSASVGANNNASGMAALMEMAEILAHYRFSHTIRMVMFDHGQAGYLGSRFYAVRGIKPGERIRGVINVDGIGHCTTKDYSQEIPEGLDGLFPEAVAEIQANRSRGDFAAVFANGRASGMASTFRTMAGKYGGGVPVVVLKATNPSAETALKTSDHAIFWRKGIPTISIGDTGTLRKVGDAGTDTVDSVDLRFVARITRSILATLVTLGEVRHCTVAEVAVNDL